MSSPLFLTLVFVALGCLYLYAIAGSFRISARLPVSTPWLLLPLIGAAIAGVTLIFGVHVLPAPPVSSRLLALLAHLFTILLLWSILGKIAPTNRLPGTLLYAWNPLVLIELAVYANTAGVVICLLSLALWLLVATPLVGVPSSSFTNRFSSIARTIAALVLVGLAVRINLMALLIAPLLLWFMVRHVQDVSAALMGFAWRALIVLAIFIVAYLPGWQGSATFLAITGALHLFNFTYSPLSLVVMPTRALFSFVAQSAHFPPSLMQPTIAADMTVLATSFFLFALLYLREMGKIRSRYAYPRPHRSADTIYPHRPGCPVGTRGRVGWMRGPCACPRPITIRTGSRDPQQEVSQQNENEGTEPGTPEESRPNEDKHKAPTSTQPHSLSLQDEDTDSVVLVPSGRDKSHTYDILFTSWAIVILGYIVLAATVFWPGYVVWVVWVVALRRIDRLSVCALLLSCSTLLYYPLLQSGPAATGILLPVCIFGIPLVYAIVQRYIPAGRIERKNVLT